MLPFRQSLIQVEKEIAGLVERFQHDNAFLIVAEAFLEGLLGTGQGVAFYLEQLVNDMHIAHIALGEETVPFLVLARAQHIEFLLPVTDHGGVDIQHGRHFADAVVVFSGVVCIFHDLYFYRPYWAWVGTLVLRQGLTSPVYWYIVTTGLTDNRTTAN